jgi:glucose-6-phosphate 1-dehydrogenase
VSRIADTCTHVGGDFEIFSQKISYLAGAYDSQSDFEQLDRFLADIEGDHGANRLFYLAVPPSVFAPVAHAFQPVCFSKSGL